MKLLITIALLLTALTTKAQFADTTARDRITHIELNLHKSHKQYRTGTYLVAAGLSVNGLALLAGENGGGGFLAGFGTLAIMAGTVVHIDSHKYIGRTRLND